MPSDMTRDVARAKSVEVRGLELLASWFPDNQLPPTWVDVRHDPAWFDKGVDYILPGGVFIDFKVEDQVSRSCAAELIKSDRKADRYCPNTGWLVTSESHWIAHLFLKTGELLFIPLEAYRQAILANIFSAGWPGISRRNPFDPKAPIKFLTWCVLYPSQEALQLPGAFWAQMPGTFPAGALARYARSHEIHPVTPDQLLATLATPPAPPIKPTFPEGSLDAMLGYMRRTDRCARANQANYVLPARAGQPHPSPN